MKDKKSNKTKKMIQAAMERKERKEVKKMLRPNVKLNLDDDKLWERPKIRPKGSEVKDF